MFVRLALVLLVLFLFCEAVEAGYVPPNNFTNGDFQTGSLSGWSLDALNASSGATIILDGSNYFAEVFAMTDFWWDTEAPEGDPPMIDPGDSRIWQEIIVPAGATELVFDYQGFLDLNEEGEIWLGMVLPGEFSSLTMLEPTDTWSAYSIALPAEIKGQTAIFEFSVMSYTEFGSATINLDNVALVPEPATISLLGLGVLVLRSRHKR